LIKVGTEDVTRNAVGVCNFVKGVALEGVLRVGL